MSPTQTQHPGTPARCFGLPAWESRARTLPPRPGCRNRRSGKRHGDGEEESEPTGLRAGGRRRRSRLGQGPRTCPEERSQDQRRAAQRVPLSRGGASGGSAAAQGAGKTTPLRGPVPVQRSRMKTQHRSARGHSRGEKRKCRSSQQPVGGAVRKARDPGSQPPPPSRTRSKRCRPPRAGRSTTATPTATTQWPPLLPARPSVISQHHTQEEQGRAPPRKPAGPSRRQGAGRPQPQRFLLAEQAPGGVRGATRQEEPALGAHAPRAPRRAARAPRSAAWQTAPARRNTCS